MTGMSTFNEADHPRISDGTFTDKPQSAPEVSLSPSRPPERYRRLRGHDFYPKNPLGIPGLGGQEDMPLRSQTVHIKYFGPAGDWWITEYDPQTGEAFGYAQLAGMEQFGEWGSIDLAELERVKVGPFVGVERDLYFDPAEVRSCVPGMIDKGIVQDSAHGTDIPSVHRELRGENLYDVRADISALDDGPDGYADMFVSTILDGQLSRGVAGRDRVASLRSWREYAASLDTVEAAEFAAGVEEAARTLYATKISDDASFEEVCTIALTKRASQADREQWQAALRQARSKPRWNGMMTAAAALSGTDTWWGLRNDPAATIHRK